MTGCPIIQLAALSIAAIVTQPSLASAAIAAPQEPPSSAPEVPKIPVNPATSTEQAVPTPNPGQIPSDTEPTHFAAKIGLGFTPPPGSMVKEHRNRGRDVLQILDGADPPSWTISFQRVEATKLGETTKSRIDSVLKGLSEQEDPAELRSRSEMRIRVVGGSPEDVFPAELLYLNVPFEEGSSGGVSGLLVAQTTPYTFLYGTLFAQREAFDQGDQATLNELYRSLRIQPQSVIQLNEAVRVDAASRVLEKLTPEVLRTVALRDEQEFYRVYEQSSDGSQREVAWQRLSTRLAPISAVSESPSNDLASQELGLLVTIVGENVSAFPTEKLTFDIVEQHWISLDRLEERWSVHRTPRQVMSAENRRTEKKVGTPVAVTGIRTRPQPRSTITVIDRDGIHTDLDVPVPSDLFISQTELYVLGRLLNEAKVSEFDVDWYFLEDSSANRGTGIRKRGDHYLPADESENANSTLKTRGPSGSFSQTFSAEDGTRISKIPLGVENERFLIYERIGPKQLVELYKSKNLPVR